MNVIGKYFIENQVVRSTENFESSFLKEKDTVYEVLRVVRGVPLFWKDHIDRACKSLKQILSEVCLDVSALENSVKRLIKVNNIIFGNIQIILTGESKSVLAYQLEAYYPTNEEYRLGVKVGMLDAERDRPNVKIMKTDLRTQANLLLKEKDWFEVLYVNQDGFITEGSRSNTFFVKGKDVFTAPIKAVLAGITRKYVIKACDNVRLNVLENFVHQEQINEMDAAFLTGTSPKVLPIAVVDYATFEVNTPLKKVMQAYDDILNEYIVENNRFWFI